MANSQYVGDRLYGAKDQYLGPNQSLYSENQVFELRYQDDGNLVIYRKEKNKDFPIWASQTWRTDPYQARMQPDGNFVIYTAPNNKPIWASQTWGNPNSVLIMQNDGNLVIYNENKQPIWASNTYQPDYADAKKAVEYK